MVKIHNKNLKLGFSLAEALVSMLVLSLFFMLTAKTISIKQKDESIPKLNGFYECFIDVDGTLKEQYADSGTSLGITSPQVCRFSSPSRKPNVVIYTLNNQRLTTKSQPYIDENRIITRFDLEGFWRQFDNDPQNPNSDFARYNTIMLDGADAASDMNAIKSTLINTYGASRVVQNINGDAYTGPALLVVW